MHTVIIERMSRYTRWFRVYKAANRYSALQGLADKIDKNYYTDKTIVKAIRTTRIINYELELWGDVNVQNKYGITALHYAAYYNAVESLKVLVNFGVNKNIKDIKGKLAYNRTTNSEIREMLK